MGEQVMLCGELQTLLLAVWEAWGGGRALLRAPVRAGVGVVCVTERKRREGE